MKYSCSYICVCKCISIYVKMYVFHMRIPVPYNFAYWNAVPITFLSPSDVLWLFSLEREKDPLNSFPGKLTNIICNGTSPIWGKKTCLFVFFHCQCWLVFFVGGQHPPDLPPPRTASCIQHLCKGTWQPDGVLDASDGCRVMEKTMARCV